MSEEIQNITDRYPILKDRKGIEKDEFLILNKKYIRQPRRLNNFWFFRNLNKNSIIYYTNLEIA